MRADTNGVEDPCAGSFAVPHGTRGADVNNSPVRSPPLLAEKAGVPGRARCVGPIAVETPPRPDQVLPEYEFPCSGARPSAFLVTDIICKSMLRRKSSGPGRKDENELPRTCCGPWKGNKKAGCQVDTHLET
jgi:hypothetical protein